MRYLVLKITVSLSLLPMLEMNAIAAKSPPIASISEIKNNPMKYDGKVIRVVGWLASGHVGISLYEENKCNSIYIRHPNEIVMPPSIHISGDNLFEAFWEFAKDELLPYKGYIVEIEALVRILKDKNGQLAKEFTIYGQYPFELVPIRIIEIGSSKNSKAKHGSIELNPCLTIERDGTTPRPNGF